MSMHKTHWACGRNSSIYTCLLLSHMRRHTTCLPPSLSRQTYQIPFRWTYHSCLDGECLVQPIREDLSEVEEFHHDTLVGTNLTLFVPMSPTTSHHKLPPKSEIVR
ncbi:uncharacterized protein BO95DRAFT_126623 [Aspergillus brunneoviolaceus CBS 621.78]|uniref:Uncharacterized protein n=1 Tax=Aspergillus brunneoviolaceus CBS 621.78 TaxID=1450534 RepID=A0ACD1G9M3_9EURO|nr:hypothetical protein BO95DRAFT_126623 [Aspergillus brunneoviolaceus CBS 621.78]RAH45917.1 hypothetical protein BO95DRAFT_126623 [Aspergillus brunneoviolaceus CBS 621.78]